MHYTRGLRPTARSGLGVRGSPICSACLFPPCRLPYPGGPTECLWPFLPRSPWPSPALQRLGIHTYPPPSVLAGVASRGCKVRFMLRPGRIAGPSPTRTVTPELSLAGSPRTSVGYHYAGKQPIPAAGLAPARHAALWAACKARKDRKGPPYFRKLGRLDCSEFSSSTLVISPVRAGNSGGFSACFASFAVQLHCLGSVL